MMRRILIMVLVLLSCLSVSAQGATGYQLRTPSADEVLETVTALWHSVFSDDARPWDMYPTARGISDAFFHLYPDPTATSFDRLFETYTTMGMGQLEVYARGQWVRYMVVTWITEHDVDLGTVDNLQFEDFHITVTPHDFNGDGVDEYVLDTMKGSPIERTACHSDTELLDYIVLEQTDVGYQLVETGLPWKGYPPSGRLSAFDGGVIELGIEDLTGDSLPEWLVVVNHGTFGGPGMGYSDEGQLYVLSWRDDRLVDLMPEIDFTHGTEFTTRFSTPTSMCNGERYPATVTWDFVDVDGDSTLEIRQSQTYRDNWLCERIETKRFEWDVDVDRYVYLDTQSVYTEGTQHCLQRRAEGFMWGENYGEAIPLYESALVAETLELDEYLNHQWVGLNQYLRARLAFAYMMTGQDDLAVPLLEDLETEEILDEAIGLYVSLLTDLNRENIAPLGICTATYRLFTEHFPRLVLGVVVENLSGLDAYAYYRPENIACDAPALINEMLNTIDFEVGIPPIEQLATLGIEIVDMLETDLNQDGLPEWLVWPDVPGLEYFFAPQGAMVVVSETQVDPFRRATDMAEISLPGNASSAIGALFYNPLSRETHIRPWYAVYSGGGLGGPWRLTCPSNDSQTSAAGSLQIWRLDGAGLVRILSASTCTGTLEEQFSDGAPIEVVFQVLQGDFIEGEYEPVERVYIWNDDSQVYEFVEPESEETMPPVVSQSSEPQLYNSAEQAFLNDDFEMVLQITSNLIEHEEPFPWFDFYLRALSLEALGREAEALEAYITVAMTNPESIWGRLAPLHFEPTGP